MNQSMDISIVPKQLDQGFRAHYILNGNYLAVDRNSVVARTDNKCEKSMLLLQLL